MSLDVLISNWDTITPVIPAIKNGLLRPNLFRQRSLYYIVTNEGMGCEFENLQHQQ